MIGPGTVMRRLLIVAATTVAAGAGLPSAGLCGGPPQPASAGPTVRIPPDLAMLLAQSPEAGPAFGPPTEARHRALVEAATAQGMEGGLAWRTHAIVSALNARAADLDAVWDFEIMITRDAGAIIVPPIVRRVTAAMRLATKAAAGGNANDPGGAADHVEAVATARHVWHILSSARIAVRRPDWRDFLVREWQAPDPLPAIYMPRSDTERQAFETSLRGGWRDGVALADAIHGKDLDRLTQTWLGLAEWRRLVHAGMAAPPVIRQDRTGVSGGGPVLRLDETLVRLTGRGRLNPVTGDWQPLERHSGGGAAQ